MWLTGINYSNRTEPNLTILFECRYEFLVLLLKGILPSPLYLVFYAPSHLQLKIILSLEHCVLCRAVNKSIRTTAAEIELQLYKVFLNTKKACLKRVCCVIQQKTRPLAKFFILFQKFIFWTYSLLHLAWFMLLFWKSHSETWQAFWQISS